MEADKTEEDSEEDDGEGDEPESELEVVMSFGDFWYRSNYVDAVEAFKVSDANVCPLNTFSFLSHLSYCHTMPCSRCGWKSSKVHIA